MPSPCGLRLWFNHREMELDGWMVSHI